jgi:hypothetical protein
MRIGVITTDYGKHSDEKLATVAASEMVQNTAEMTGQQAIDMRRVETAIIDALIPHFRAISDREHAGIAADGHDHLMKMPIHAHPESAEAMEAVVVKVVRASPAAACLDYRNPGGEPAVENHIRDVIHRWIRNAQHMHRDYWARHGLVGHGTQLNPGPIVDPTHALDRPSMDKWRTSRANAVSMYRDWHVTHGAEIPAWDPDHEHVKTWIDLHDAPTAEAYRWALHKQACISKGLPV